MQSDMIAYFYNLKNVHSLTQTYSIVEIINQNIFEKGFTLLQVFLGEFVDNVQFYGILMYGFNLALLLLAAVRCFGLETVPFVMIQYIFFNIFNTISLIVVRQGLAIGILVLALANYLTGKKKFSIVLMLIAAQFHSTAYLMVLAILVIEIFKINLNLLLFFWGVSSVLYITGWNQILVEHLPFNSQYLANYTGELWTGQSAIYGQTPNSLKYLIYSAVFLFVMLIFQRFFLKNDVGALLLMRVYVVWNTLFLILGFVAFSSRIALYSWMLLPFILFYVFWTSSSLKNYYPLLLILWILIGLKNLPIFGWIAG